MHEDVHECMHYVLCGGCGTIHSRSFSKQPREIFWGMKVMNFCLGEQGNGLRPKYGRSQGFRERPYVVGNPQIEINACRVRPRNNGPSFDRSHREIFKFGGLMGKH